MTGVSYSDNLLRIGDKEVELDYPIKKILEENELIIVLMKVPSGTNTSGNIEAYNYQGEKVWQVEDLSTDSDLSSSTYMGLKKRDSKVVSNTFDGGIYEIDLKTGDVDLVDNIPK